MKFVVDYRAADGSRQQKEIEAADRKAAFAELSRMGISAITLRDGALSKKAKTAKSPSKPLPPSVLRGVFAGIVVVALVVAAWILFSGREELPKEEKIEKRGLIKEIAFEPSKGSTLPDENVSAGTGTEVKSHATAGSSENAGKTRPVFGVGARAITNAALIARGKPQVFRHKAERGIAMLLTTEFGTPVLGRPHYDRRFLEDLKDSFSDPIVIDPTDDEETRVLKENVQGTKEYLREQMQNGVDVCDILTRTFDELQDAGVYYMWIKKELKNEKLKPGATEGDVDSFVEAANILLEKRGIKSISLSETSREILRRRSSTADIDSEK